MASVLSKKQKRRREKYSLNDLKTLGNQLLSSKSHINNLPLLLTFISPSSKPQLALESLLSLHSFFTPILPDLPPSSSSANSNDAAGAAADDPEFIYRTWVRSKFDEFVHSLITLAVSPLSEEALREVVMDTLLECVKVANGGKFHSSIYHKFIHAIVHSASGVESLLNLLVTKYFKYIDVRYFTYISLEKLSRTFDVEDVSVATADAENESQSKASRELSVRKLHQILSNIPPLEELDKESEYEMWNGSGVFTKESTREEPTKTPKSEGKKGKTKKTDNKVLLAANVSKKMKVKFTKAWISLLKLPVPVDVYKEILATLPQAVIPHFSNPIMLSDFLTRSYDIGGVISVMALSSLHILMTEHGLQYPNFYEKLYALLEPSIFMAKHRAKFFQLLDSCLKSPLLPAYLAAAFAKKLSRLALSVPPSGGLVIIALIHNLLRRHPSVNCLVHQEDYNETTKDVSEAESSKVTSSNRAGVDLFNNEEADLAKTNALRSSLWEIDTLRHHYCPPVSTFVLSLETDLTVRYKTTEVAVNDFSSGSYATIFKEEIRRRVKQVPLAFYKTTPTSLFSESDFAGWTFKCNNGVAADSNNKVSSSSEELESNSTKRQRTECS